LTPRNLRVKRTTVKSTILAVVTVVMMFATAGSATAQGRLPGTEEFGLSERELVEKIEAVEPLIAKCMREHGFQYIAADYKTVRKGMAADKTLPGLGGIFASEKTFVARHGYGISTFYTGKPLQLADGYNPGKIGLGDQNIRIFKNLSPADRVAYNRALLGEDTNPTFAVALEIEDFSRTGGCTRTAIAQVFKPEQLKATYYNPKDALVNQDPRMKAALAQFADALRKAGYDYSHPDQIERDLRTRLHAITKGLPLEQLSADARAALKKLQDYERALAVVAYDLETRIVDPVEARVEKDLYARPIK
jgi:hypothetical protein